MKKPLLIALPLLLAGAAIFIYATWPRSPAPATASISPDKTTSPSPVWTPAAAPPARQASPSSAAPVAIPEELMDPHALDPVPLPLDLGRPPFQRQKDGRILKTDVARSAANLNDENHDPVEDLQILDSIVGAYRTIFRENPVAGENREVVAALTGKNAYNLMFIEPNHPAIRGGELADRWGTPFRFHPFSGEIMEVSSAGPDQQFGTGDDVHIDDPRPIGPAAPAAP